MNFKKTWLVFIVSVALVSCAPVGMVTPTEMHAPTPIILPTPTLTAIPPTATAIPVYDINVQVFHDYSGNGKMDAGEPPLIGVLNSIGSSQCTTGSDGLCTLENIAEGKQTIDVNAPDQFGYLTPNSSSRVKLSTQSGLNIQVIGDATINIPLAHGSIILPFDASSDYRVNSWFDLCTSSSCVANWLGQTENWVDSTGYNASIRVQDRHYALDYVFQSSVSIYAADFGVINAVEPDQSTREHMRIGITSKGTNVEFDYGHLINIPTDIKPGVTIHRGQLLGYAAPRPRPLPNDGQYPFILHFGINPIGGCGYECSIDPYSSPGLFTIIFTPQDFVQQ